MSNPPGGKEDNKQGENGSRNGSCNEELKFQNDSSCAVSPGPARLTRPTEEETPLYIRSSAFAGASQSPPAPAASAFFASASSSSAKGGGAGGETVAWETAKETVSPSPQIARAALAETSQRPERNDNGSLYSACSEAETHVLRGGTEHNGGESRW